MSNFRISPEELAAAQGQKFPPTPQQAAIIGAAPGPRLVVAGAGAGKTETMANRVVWLVANGFVEPERVLGLTFTRKAAQQLRQRIRTRLGTFSQTPQARDIDPTLGLLKLLENINPTVSTYDSYAGRLVGEYGLLLPVEPSARLITNTELYSIAREVVVNYSGSLSVTTQVPNVTETLLGLSAEIDNHMVDMADIAAETEAFVQLFYEITDDKGNPAKITQPNQAIIDSQKIRLEYLPLVRTLKEKLQELKVITFGEQMTLAARLAQTHPEVGARERTKFGVVMLDEYQDTSHAQRILLRSLFGAKDQDLTITAVGDPMQSIYGWRGATAANLERFVQDFPVLTEDALEVKPAPKSELTTSFRNPANVLTGANAVADEAFRDYTKKTRPVQPLKALPANGEGTVGLAWFANESEEMAWVADKLATVFNAPREEPFTGAVLVRKKKHIPAIAEALEQRGVPVEIVGLSGLLTVPEVQDLLAVATMLINPQDNAAAIRILTGAAVNLGANDLLALDQRTRNLSGRSAEDPGHLPQEPLEKLQWTLANSQSPDPALTVGLTDALADLGEPEKYSEAGLARMRELAAALRYLRTYSMGRGLSDLFADIDRIMGIRTEVLARQNPHADGAPGTAHLDTFAEYVAQYEAIPGANLPGLLDYFKLALEEEDGLEPGEVTVRSERVQILTVHKSKGLEWQHVAVIHADNRTYVDETAKGHSTKTWLSDITKIPSTLRGDARAVDDLSGAPILEVAECETMKELTAAIKDHKADFRKTEEAEAARLFYVAITRSEQCLYVSASFNWSNSATYQNAPYKHLQALATVLPNSVEHWAEEFDEARQEQVVATGEFPSDALGQRRSAVESAAEQVRHMLNADAEQTIRYADSELTMQWEADVTALIEEQAAHAVSTIEVPVLAELTATDMVSLHHNPEFFARRSMRPVPFKPNAFAKRGTQFHEWLERRFGATSLLDQEQLAEDSGELLSEPAVEQLKVAFLESEWAQRTPEFVEQPFEVSIGKHVVRGRMDAVFRIPPVGTSNTEPAGVEHADSESAEITDPTQGWMIVDWKTGKPPAGAELRTANIQLAVYRLAWAELLSRKLGIKVDAKQIRTAFYYVATGFTYEPGKLPDASELARILEP